MLTDAQLRKIKDLTIELSGILSVTNPDEFAEAMCVISTMWRIYFVTAEASGYIDNGVHASDEIYAVIRNQISEGVKD